MSEKKDPFGRPLDSYAPRVLTPEESEKIIEEARKQEQSASELAKRMRQEREEAIAAPEELKEEDDEDLTDKDIEELVEALQETPKGAQDSLALDEKIVHDHD